MKQEHRLLNSPYWLWILLALPLCVMTWRYVTGGIFYGEYLHATGEFSARLLILTMAVTPLRLIWPKQAWPNWLLRQRRYFGVAAFAYAVPHLVAYLVKLASVARILEDGTEAGIWTGWLALLLFVPLAATSNNWGVRVLKGNWKRLHRLVYSAAILTFVHWLLVAFDPVPALIHVAVLVGLETIRVWKSRARRATA